jgi:Transposase C of IS166 homeodomain
VRKRFWHTARTTTSRAALPDLDKLDSSALRTLILTQHQQLLLKEEQLASRDAEIEQLKLLIVKLRRMQFGRKSEKVERRIEQLLLGLIELEASRAEQSGSPGAVPETRRTAQTQPTRRPLLEHLPREMRRIPPNQQACPECSGDLREVLSRIADHPMNRIKELLPSNLAADRSIDSTYAA